MVRWLLAAAVLVGASTCARRSEFIGRLPGAGATDAHGREAEADAGGDGPPSSLSCPQAEPNAPSAPPPAWNCGGPERCLREPEVDPAVFASALPDPDPQRRPVIVYPLPGSMHPLNLPRITLQWQRGSPAQTSFRIRMRPVAPAEPPYELFVAYRRPSRPTSIEERDASHEIGPELWRYIAQQTAGRAVELTVFAHDPAANRVAASETITIRFSPQPVSGGLYYLATEPPRPGIHRHVFGALTASAAVPPRSAANAFDCGGCHAVSRDGHTLAFAATYAGNLTVASTTALENPTRRPPPPPPDSADAVAPSVSPDGKYIVARHRISGSLVVYDASGAPQTALSTYQTEGRIDFPEWSPDGREIVATRARSPTQPPDPSSSFDGQLVVLAFADGQLSPPQVVVSEPNQVHAYPSWSPDGQWIVFVSSPAGSESRKNPMARLRLVRRSGDGSIIELTRAMAAGLGVGTTFPRFAPFGQQGCQLLFITFHSRMDYGILRRNSKESEGGWPQLWMSALDVSRPGDPSYPPVWLPFQDINQKNVLPSWTTTIPCTGATCGTDAVCMSEGCVPSFD